MLFAVTATAGGGGQQSQKNDDEEDGRLEGIRTRNHAHGVIQLVYRCISIGRHACMQQSSFKRDTSNAAFLLNEFKIV